MFFYSFESNAVVWSRRLRQAPLTRASSPATVSARRARLRRSEFRRSVNPRQTVEGCRLTTIYHVLSRCSCSGGNLCKHIMCTQGQYARWRTVNISSADTSRFPGMESCRVQHGIRMDAPAGLTSRHPSDAADQSRSVHMSECVQCCAYDLYGHWRQSCDDVTI